MKGSIVMEAYTKDKRRHNDYIDVRNISAMADNALWFLAGIFDRGEL